VQHGMHARQNDLGISVNALAAVLVTAALRKLVAGAGTPVEVDGCCMVIENEDLVTRGKMLLTTIV
jgi:hypothetical protein